MEKIELKGVFRLLDYRISHKILLIRSSQINKDGVLNTDILFDGVFYLEIVEQFENIEISEIEDSGLIDKLKARIEHKTTFPIEKFFALSTKHKTYYIGARRCRINENNLPPLESNLHD